MLCYLFICCIIISSSVHIAQGSNLYVSPEGSSTDCSSQNPCSNIQLAVSLAQDGDIINLAKGTYVGSSNTRITLTKSLTFLGTGMADVIIDMQGSGKAFDISNVSATFTEMSFVNGNASDSGGAIAISGDVMLTVINCAFVNNLATLAGGAIYLQNNASITMAGTFFTSNQAKGDGGALCFDDASSNSVINNCTFTYNTANQGGAIYAAESKANATNITFIGNHAEEEGGAGYLISASVMRMQNAMVWNCSSHLEGGGFYVGYGSTVVMSDSKLAFCVSPNGAAIHADNHGGAQLYGCSVYSNLALNGAGIYAAGSRVFVVGSQITNNVANQHAGAIFIADEAKVYLTSASINLNEASHDGGAIYIKTRSILGLVNTSITDNEVFEEGTAGGVFCSDSHIFFNTSCDISGNTVQNSPDDPDFFCSSIPPGTHCTISGDSKYTSNSCGLAPYESMSNSKLPLLAVVGIALGGAAMVICVVLLIGCIIWRRKSSSRSQSTPWKKIRLTRKDDDSELLEDYD